MIPPPETAESRQRWRLALDEYLARRARTERLRAELAAARAAGKARRHAERLRRNRAGDTNRKESSS